MRIFLIGYMGSGKSTVGKKISAKLKFDFVDVDDFIEKKYKITINDFFKKHGEIKFRELENSCLSEIIKNDNIVISTGGGLPCFSNNIQIINNSGISIYLKLSVNALYSRLKDSQNIRPIIEGLSGDNLKEFIKNQLAEREKHYLQSNYIINGISVDYKELTSIINIANKKIL